MQESGHEMNCAEYHDWLDKGHPGAKSAAAEAHEASCVSCAAELEAGRFLDHALRQRFATAPPSFTERVMERIPASRAAAFDDPTGRPALTTLLRDGLFNLNVISAAALLMAMWIPGIDRWRSGFAALPSVLERFLTAGPLGVPLDVPVTLPLMPRSVPLVTIPLLALSLYLLYRLGVAMGKQVSLLLDA